MAGLADGAATVAGMPPDVEQACVPRMSKAVARNLQNVFIFLQLLTCVAGGVRVAASLGR